MAETLALISAIMFAVANVLVTKGATPQSKDNGAFLSILISAFMASVMVILTGFYSGWPGLNTSGVLWFCLAGALTAFLGRVFLYSSIQHLGSVRAATVKRLIPFFAVIIGVLLLNEPLTVPMVMGMVLIFSGFIILARDRLSKQRKDNQQPSTKTQSDIGNNESNHPPIRKLTRTPVNIGYVLGPISALSYAFGALARKKGLLEIPEPFFGAMLGAFVAILVFLIIAVFQQRYRTSVRLTFTQFKPWLFFAGTTSSFGHIFLFYALFYGTLSRVILINSMEVFITIFFSVWIFRTRENLTPVVIIAAIISTSGTILIVW